MYEVDKHDRVTELNDVPQSSIGAPIPILLAGDLDVLLTYYLESEHVAIVRFKQSYAHMFGPPNDEGFHGHPLSERGLEPYGALPESVVQARAD